ncbi:immunity-related GTPases-like protein, partial [Pterulicium gracile]
FHFGISGTVKSGKSSIINSLRGLGLTDTLAADVDPNECTRVVTRYEDPRPDHPFAWYDIPGSGTANIPAESYFNSQGLFAMDCILNLIHDSFSENDAQLVRQCNELCIPTYLVRSKSDQDIRNLKDDRGLE